MLDFIDLMSQIFYALTHPGSLFGSIFGVLALLCFGKFILGCQTGNWLLIIGGLFLTALLGFLAYKLLFSQNCWEPTRRTRHEATIWEQMGVRK